MPRTKSKTPTRGQIIQLKAVEILEKHDNGLQRSDLVREVKKSLKEYKPNTINGALRDLTTDMPDRVYKPEWGLFKHTMYKQADTPEEAESDDTAGGSEEGEKELYQPFADFLKAERECTKAVKVGGKAFGEKWSTPDVVGKYELPKQAQVFIQSDPLIVSAEIKDTTDKTELITAFGQACVYKLFSHKVYIAIPRDLDDEFRRKIESLCAIMGIGVVLHDRDNKDNLFEVRIRAVRTNPDMYYVNKYMPYLQDELWGSG